MLVITKSQRIAGIDVARALAVFGMVIVNFKIVMNAESGHPVLLWFAGLFEGRAAALFVVLAGIGVTFLTNQARRSGNYTAGGLSLVKRGLLLIGIGLLYTPIWEADILHFYGAYFLVAATLFATKDRVLLSAAVVVLLVFPMLMLLFDYDRHWDWSTLTYQNLWSVDGMIRHILFNGFHPVFPWCAFLLFGMWLGRLDLNNSRTRVRLLIGSVSVLVLVEVCLYLLRVTAGDGHGLGMTAAEVGIVFSSAMMPPLPQYLVSASASATVVLIGCLYASDRFAGSAGICWLTQVGKLSLTLYVAHVVVGMGLLDGFGLLTDQSIGFALISALVFCSAAVAFSVWLLKHWTTGPLEWLFRRVAS